MGRPATSVRSFVTTLDVDRSTNYCRVCLRELKPGDVVMAAGDEMTCFGRGCYREWESTRLSVARPKGDT